MLRRFPCHVRSSDIYLIPPSGPHPAGKLLRSAAAAALLDTYTMLTICMPMTMLMSVDLYVADDQRAREGGRASGKAGSIARAHRTASRNKSEGGSVQVRRERAKVVHRRFRPWRLRGWLRCGTHSRQYTHNADRVVQRRAGAPHFKGGRSAPERRLLIRPDRAFVHAERCGCLKTVVAAAGGKRKAGDQRASIVWDAASAGVHERT